jgi:site-specific recombinase XerC
MNPSETYLWLASLGNHGTRRLYNSAVEDFGQFTAMVGAGDFRAVTRLHVVAWRQHLIRRGLRQSTVRHRLAAMSAFFEYLCKKEFVAWNPVTGVKRPKNFVSARKASASDDEHETEAICCILDIVNTAKYR